MTQDARTFSTAERQRLHRWYEQAAKLVANGGDFEQTHQLFLNCVVEDPGNHVYLDSFLRHLEKRQASQRGRRWWSLRRLFQRRKLGQLAARKEWETILRMGPAMLRENVAEVATLCHLAAACDALGHAETAWRYLQKALAVAPDNPLVNEQAARQLSHQGRFAEALEYRRKASHASGMRWLDRVEGVPSGAGDWEQLVDAEPTNPQHYVAWGQSLRAQRRFPEAERVLTRGLSATGNNLQILALREEIAVAHARHSLTIAELQAVEEPLPVTRELVERMRQEVDRLELELAFNRCRRMPGDGELKLELARRLRSANKFREAVDWLLQSDRQMPGNAEVLVELGECYQQLKQFPQAMRSYERAVAAADSAANETAGETAEETRKRSLYRAGTLAAALPEPNKAAEFLGRLMQLDSAYKDVRLRLDKLRENHDKD